MADADSIRCCAKCGEQFAPRVNKTTGQPSARPRIYCSRDCLKKASRLREKVRPRQRGPRNPQRVEGFCPSCGLHFVRARSGGIGGPADSGKYCSRECYARRQATLSRERQALRRIGANWRWCPSQAVVAEIAALRRIARYVERPRKTIRPCTHCGAPTVGTMEYGRTCAKCIAERRRASSKASPSRRIYKARRRAIERGADADRIDPIKVFERDKWRCHLCGCKTPRRQRGTYEPDAPELDHVIPLAAGGSHTWGNVKCACRRCNGDKGAEPRGQLGLEMAA